MDNLITALQILRKYGNPEYPTHCEHDVLSVNIDPAIVSNEDKETLCALDFFVSSENRCFESFRFGSC